MRISSGFSWRSAVSVASVAVFALTTVANAGPLVKQDASGRIQQVDITGTPQVQYSIQAQALGRSSAASGDAFVYKYNTISGYGLFSNMQPATGAYGIGSFDSSPFQLGNGFNPATDQINGYQLAIFRSTLDPGMISGTLATMHTELWDGDPFFALGTAGGGYANAKIAGTDGDWDGIPAGTFRWYVTEFAPVSVPHQDVFMVVTSSMCRIGYMIDSLQAPIGAAHLPYGDLFLIQSDYDGQFAATGSTCCEDTDGTGLRACEITTAPCTMGNGGFDTAGRGMCSDGDAESAGIFYFGGPCDGVVGDFCSDFVVDIFAPANFSVALVPVSGDVANTISGNRITMAAGGGHVWLHLMYEGWGYAGQEVKTWQGKLDPSGYYSAAAGFLTPWNPGCTVNADCLASMGSASSFCNDIAYPPGGCLPGYQDFVQFGNAIQLGIPAVSTSNLAFTYGSTALTLNAADPGSAAYGGTLVLEVSGDAAGIFSVGFNPADTWMKAGDNSKIALIGLTDGEIEITTGKCCNLFEQPFVCDSDGITADQCAALASATFVPLFTANENCTDNPSCSCNDIDANCDDGDACTTDLCNIDSDGDGSNDVCSNDDNFDGAVDCCDVEFGTLDPRDDGNQCTTDSCTDDAGSRGAAIHDAGDREGGACDDGEPCTTVEDTCLSGACIGTDILTVACTSNALCEGLTSDLGSCNPVSGFCRCVPPSLFPNTADLCYAPGDKVAVSIDFSDVPVTVVGGQFTAFYDPACMDFNSAAGADPFTTLLALEVDEIAGSIFMAVGVDPLIGVGVLAGGSLADLSFSKIDTGCDVCNVTLGGMNPQDVVLSDDNGNVVLDIELKPSGDIRNDANLGLTVPGDASVNRDCDFPTAIVNWDAPAASSDCCAANLDCGGTYPDGSAIPAVIVMGGGELPTGISTFACTAWEDCCGGSANGGWSVTVSENSAVDITVQLEPTIVASDLLRCIELGFYTDCSSAPQNITVDMNFGGINDWLGHYTEVVKLPVDGNIICVTAKDNWHTLRATASTSCVGGVYTAVFKGDPDFFGGNWLPGGNLDSKKGGGSADVIDITDFGMLVSQYGATGVALEVCGEGGFNADINADGNVDELDFAYIQRNYGKSSKDSCCPDGVAGLNTTVRNSITNRELRALGMGDLTIADLDHNGQVDLADMQAFQSGVRPVKKNIRGASSLRK